MGNYFKNMPSGYTANYFFEFRGGYVTFRELGSTPDAESRTILLAKPIPDLRNRILIDLFGKTDLQQLRLKDLTLPVNPGRVLTKAKLKSLAKKYFSIPSKFLKHYPQVVLTEEEKESVESKQKKRTMRTFANAGRHGPVEKKRRVGRPCKPVQIVPGIQSITKFFRSSKD